MENCWKMIKQAGSNTASRVEKVLRYLNEHACLLDTLEYKGNKTKDQLCSNECERGNVSTDPPKSESFSSLNWHVFDDGCVIS